MRYAVIMAGGVGSRFWPSSRVSKPKQFLNLLGERSMIQGTVDRIKDLIPVENILIITNEDYKDLVKEQLPDIPSYNIIGEPVAKNTAPCVAVAAAILKHRDPDATMVVLPADHHITRPETFREILEAGITKAESGSNLVTVGITPYRPETGYGYIQLDETHKEPAGSHHSYKVKTFAEKPDIKTAISFLESGDFLWNSGMFIWTAKTVLEEFKKHQPAIYNETEVFLKNIDGDFDKALYSFYHAVTSISIDYGIMEKADTVYVVPGDFGWSDVGSWLAVYEQGEKDADGNVLEAVNTTVVGSHNCLIRSGSNKLIALVGLHDIGVVETDDAILVTRLDSSQEVKKVFDELDKNGLKSFK